MSANANDGSASNELLRYQSVLLRMGADSSAEFPTFLRRVLKSDAAILGVDRVSYWQFESDGQSIRCVTLYSLRSDDFSGGENLVREKVPAYFKALEEALVIVAEDARTDERTCAFSASYLEPHDIGAMLDAPVWTNGRLAGVLCHEHTGGVRSWRPEEQAFAFSMAQFVSMGLERDERQRAERALREARESLAILGESAADLSMVLLDPEGRIRSGAELVRGFWADELAGKDHSVFFAPEDVEQGRPAEALREAARTGRFQEELWLVRRDGSRFWARITIRPLYDEGQSLRGFAAVAQDLTARQLALENARLLEASRRSAETNRLLAELSAEISASLNTQRILPRAAKLLAAGFADACTIQLGHPKQPIPRLTTRAIASRLPEEKELLRRLADVLADRHRWGPAIQCLADEGQAVLTPELDESGIPALTSNRYAQALLKELLPVSFIMVPLRARRRVLGTLSVLRHDPMRRFDDEALRVVREAAQRISYAVDNARLYNLARESIRIRDDFLTVAAHELRTPLTTLKLQVQLAEKDLRRFQPEGNPHFTAVHRQLQRLTHLVHELLEVSRLSSGRLALQRGPLNLSRMVQELTAAFQDEAARVGSALTFDVQPGVLGRWDAGRIEQVITNLLSNAIKYGQGHPIEVHLSATDDEAILVVRDHGVGIASEDQQRIFGRFERAASSRHFGGLGLGLFIVRRIVDAHRGDVEVDSEPGRGTTFVVRLPRWLPAETREDVDLARPTGEDARILH